MPTPTRYPQPAPSRNPADWLPQTLGNRPGSVDDPIIEPRWGGVRVIVRVEAGRAIVADETGLDATEEFAEAAQAIAKATQAQSAVFDGYLTVEATQHSVGVALMGFEAPKVGQEMASMVVGTRKPRVSERTVKLDADTPIAFVAVDLLSIDGTHLLDVPLLERKRLLEGALVQGDLVRITPFIRPPIGPFAATWLALGFREIVYKGANSRYVPDGRGNEWSAAAISRR